MFWLLASFVPGRVWKLLILLPVVLFLGVPFALVVLSGGATGAASTFLEYQCASAVGPDPSATETPTFAVDDTLDANDIPSTNPYAGQTTDAGASQWQNDCVEAMNTAPLQLPPLGTINADADASCARTLALGQVGDAVTAGAGSLSGPSDGGFSPEGFARYVIYQASTSTGRCAEAATSTQSQPAVVVTASNSDTCAQAVGAAASSAASALVIPGTTAAQGMCGQRVATSAVSAGDLVFWEYRDDRPTREGVAVDGDQMVTGDPAGGRFALESIPTTSDVVVKRFLG